MKKLFLLLALVLVALLHPTAIFAMDAKGIVKATKEIAGDIGKLFTEEQKENFGSELDDVVEGKGGNFQQAFPSSSSSYRNETSSFSGLSDQSFPNTRDDSIKGVQNLDDVRTSIGQRVMSTLDAESKAITQTDFCGNKLNNIQIITAARVASRIASRVSFFSNPTVSEYINEYIVEYVSEYNKESSEYIIADIDNLSVATKSTAKDIASWNAQEDALKDVLESKDVHAHRDYLQSVLNNTSKKTSKRVSKEAAKAAIKDVSKDLSQDQENTRISFRDQRDANYIYQYISTYACQYAEHTASGFNNTFSYDEWFKNWSFIYEKVIDEEKGIHTEEERDSMTTNESDASPKSINFPFSQPSDTESIDSNLSEVSAKYEGDTDHLNDDEYKITKRKSELATAWKRRDEAIQKFSNWHNIMPFSSSARDHAKIVISETKKNFALLFKDADKAWREFQEAQNIDARRKDIGGLDGKKTIIAAAEARLRESRDVVSEAYWEKMVNKMTNAKTAGPYTTSIEAAMSELFWRKKNKKKIIFNIPKKLYPTAEEWKDKVIEDADKTVFELVWPEVIKTEKERNERINQIKDQVFKEADDIWSTYIKPQEAPEDPTYINAQVAEGVACNSYAEAVLKEATKAARGASPGAAEGAWTVRAEASVEAVSLAAKTVFEKTTLRSMFLSIAPWASFQSFESIFADAHKRTELIEAARLAMTNMGY